MKKCIACGMPMNTPSEFAMGDITKDYCVHCARADGSMQSYDEKLLSLTELIVFTQGIDRRVARDTAKTMMKELPAWIAD